MHAEIVTVNIGRERHGLEGLDECVEDGLVATVLTEYFLAEGEVLGHGDRLVVSTEERDLRWKIDFEAEKENANLDGVVATVDVVAQEKHVGLGQIAVVNDLLEHVDHIVELAVDVAHDDHRLFDLDHVWLMLYIHKTRLLHDPQTNTIVTYSVIRLLLRLFRSAQACLCGPPGASASAATPCSAPTDPRSWLLQN